MEEQLLYIIKLNIVVSIVILAAAFLGRRLKNRYTASWKYAVWLILSLVLLFPVNPFPKGVVTVKITEEAGNGAKEDLETLSGENKEVSGEETLPEYGAREIKLPARRISWRGVLQIFFPIWIGGIILLACFRISQYLYSIRKLRRWSMPETDRAIRRIYRTECVKKRIRRPPSLLRVENLESPLLAGMVHPALYIPEKGYSLDELELIFSHELFHYRSRDLWYKMLLMTVSVLYWFNPFLSLMRIEAEKDIENLRDREVIECCQEQEKKLYQRLLLKTAALERVLAPHLAVSLNDSLLVFKDRIFYMRRAETLKRGILPAGLICLSVFLLNGAVGTSIENPAGSPSGKREPSVYASGRVEEDLAEPETATVQNMKTSASSAAPGLKTESPAAEPVMQTENPAAAPVRQTESVAPASVQQTENPAPVSVQQTEQTVSPVNAGQEPMESSQSQTQAVQDVYQETEQPETIQAETQNDSAATYQSLKDAGGIVEGTVVSRDSSGITLQGDDEGYYTFPFCEWTTVVAGEPGDHIALEYLGELQGSPMAQYAYPSATAEDLSQGLNTMEGTLTFEGNDIVGIQTAEGEEYEFMLRGIDRPDFLTPGEPVRIQYYGAPGSGEVVSFTRQ